MPLENLEEEGLPKNPDLRIAQLRFLLSLQPQSPDPAVRQELMAAIRQHGEKTGRPFAFASGSFCPPASVWGQPLKPKHQNERGGENPSSNLKA